MKLDLSRPKKCMSKISRTAAMESDPRNAAGETTKADSATFQINNAKLYVLVVTLSINNNIKCL